MILSTILSESKKGLVFPSLTFSLYVKFRCDYRFKTSCARDFKPVATFDE